jgi:hypothetical protein
VLRFSLENSVGVIWCDDVVLINNGRTLVSGDLSADGWTVRVRGLETILDRPGHFSLTIPTADGSPDGWELSEVNTMRAHFKAADGKRNWVIYSDGREYVDGRFELPAGLSLPDRDALIEQHDSPAEVSVPEEMGRVERNSPGDVNNDGYNELSGTYQLKATGGRIVVTLKPKTAKLVRPVLEIAGLPAGRITGTFEGVLVEKSIRLANGHVLVELPGSISREVTVELKVR